MTGPRSRSLLTTNEARTLTERIRVAPDATPGLVLHAFITRAWQALGYPDWGDYCRDVIPFQRTGGSEGAPGWISPLAPVRLRVVTTVRGTFDITASAEPPFDDADGVVMGRTIFRKTFTGGLSGTSTVTMTSVMTPVDGSAGYVAVERITGDISSRAGSFVVMHVGVMDRGAPSLSLRIVPDSGTGDLTGIRGSMTIDNDNGGHAYTLTYEL